MPSQTSTGMSRQSLWQHLQRRLRRCTSCGVELPKTEPRKWRCARCAERKNQRRNERRAAYRKQGRCTECGGKVDGPRPDRCRRCLGWAKD